MKGKFEHQVTAIESGLIELSDELKRLNGRLEDTQREWNDVVTNINSKSTNLSTDQPLEATSKEANNISRQNTFDANREKRLYKLVIQPSSRSPEQILATVNQNVYHQMQCANGLSSGSLAGSLDEYRQVLTQIKTKNKNLQFVTAHELSQT